MLKLPDLCSVVTWSCEKTFKVLPDPGIFGSADG